MATKSSVSLPQEIVQLIQRKIPVLTIWGVDQDGACRCGQKYCAHPGKHPCAKFCPHGHRDATTDEAVIRAWCAQDPSVNWAIPTGRASGILVFDADGKAAEVLAILLEKYGIKNPTVKTAGTHTGHHYWFHHAEGISPDFFKLLTDAIPGVDIKVDGGYVIVPPSRGVSGVYQYLGPPEPRAIPFELFKDLTSGKARPAPSTDDKKKVELSATEIDRRYERALGKLVLTRVPRDGNPGDRNNKVRDFWFEMAGLIATGYLSLERVEAEAWAIMGTLKQMDRREFEGLRDTGLSKGPRDKTLEPRLGIDADKGQIEVIEWVRRDYFPLAKPTVLAGDMGQGKSLLTIDLAAHVTTGRPFPNGGGSFGPRGAVIMSAEDDAADTIRPRLRRAGADLSRVSLVPMSKPGSYAPIDITGDLSRIEREIDEKDAALLVVDPFNAFLPLTINSWNDSSIRRAIGPVSDFANRRRVLVVLVIHFNKNVNVTQAKYRVMGSIGNVAAARAAFMVAPDPNVVGQFVFAPVKANLSRGGVPSLAYRIVGEKLDPGNLDRFFPKLDPTERTRLLVETYPRIEWGIESAHTADSLLEAQVGRKLNAVERAGDFLRELLKTGPVLEKDVEAEAMKRGLGWRNIKLAKKEVGVVSKKQKDLFEGKWFWQIDDHPYEGEL